MLNVIAVTLVLTAVLAYFNHRFVRLPTTIGVMSISLFLSAVLLGLDALGLKSLYRYEEAWLKEINFHDVLMQGMLSVLLFAGALHVDIGALKAERWKIAALAFIGTAVSAMVVGLGLWLLAPRVGLALPRTYCLVFGALISPTDPIAVLGILRTSGVPRTLEAVISGESLFNDGVGIVLFSLATSMATSGEAPSLSHIGIALLREGGGGLAFGIALGFLGFLLLKSIDSYVEEVMITLAVVVGGYAAANALGVSGPLAMVVAGLIIGNQGRAYAMSRKTREYVDMFWELLDDIFNAVLFVLIGLEVAVLPFSSANVVSAATAIVLTLLARLLVAGLPAAVMERKKALPHGAWQLLTWGGLRGGISVALALSLPDGEERDTLVLLTYAVVAFSILVQGLSVGKLTRSLMTDNR